jgi:hypothetical protein
MTWTGSGRKTAALCAAVALLGTLAIPAQVATIDRLLADAAAAQDASLAASLQANNAYGEALVELQLRRDAAAVAADANCAADGAARTAEARKLDAERANDGLVQNAFAAAGKYLPRTASQQFAQAPVHVPLSQAQPGDLLVWGSSPGFYHVAIYLGGARVVQALNEDAGITVTDLASMSGMQLYPVAARY